MLRQSLLSCRRMILALLCWLPLSASAFGSLGHQTVGAIADQLLIGTNAGKQVHKILQGLDLQTVSVWPDCAKGVQQKKVQDKLSYFYSIDPERSYPDCRQFENFDAINEMIDFVRNNWDTCTREEGDELCNKQYHYTDVAIQRERYAKKLAGTNDHDVVSAINAAIYKLQGKPVPAPFVIKSDKLALMLLAHYVGDIHQPLHVAAVYLSRDGKVIDPDKDGLKPGSKTIGGNALTFSGGNFHSEWDKVPAAMSFLLVARSNGAAAAKAIAPSVGALDEWSAAWASESLLLGREAFKDVTFSKQDANSRWAVTLPENYWENKNNVLRQQLIKGGARLAQVLEAIWP